MTQLRYTSLDRLRRAAQVRDGADDQALLEVGLAAEADIDAYCGRRFDVAAVSARWFRALDPWTVHVDDVSATAGLVVATDDDDDGTAETTWAATDFELWPLNGVGPDGSSGWPAWRISAVGDRWFPCGARAGVRVSAAWGWAGVPQPVVEAAARHAMWLRAQDGAPLGVAGFGDYGAVRVRQNATVAALLQRLVKGSSVGAVVA